MLKCHISTQHFTFLITIQIIHNSASFTAEQTNNIPGTVRKQLHVCQAHAATLLFQKLFFKKKVHILPLLRKTFYFISIAGVECDGHSDCFCTAIFCEDVSEWHTFIYHVHWPPCTLTHPDHVTGNLRDFCSFTGNLQDLMTSFPVRRAKLL